MKHKFLTLFVFALVALLPTIMPEAAYAAIGATVTFEVEGGLGSDTLNSGGFDPAASGMKTDLAATVATSSAPVVTATGYNFVSSDVNSFLYIQSGTNWIPGWYKIASVASNAATLSAACATTASPTSGKWAVDYSQQAANRATGTVTSSSTTVTATTSIFAESMIGNLITDGTNPPREITAYTSATVVTVDAAPTWTAATVYSGGAYNTIQTAFNNMVSLNSCYVKATGTYAISTGLTHATQSTSTLMRVIGYTSTRGDGGQATIQATAAITMMTWSQNGWSFENLIFDGNSATATNGINVTGGTVLMLANCVCKNFSGAGIIDSISSIPAILSSIEVSGCGGTAGISLATNTVMRSCYVHGNTVPGVSCAAELSMTDCIVSNNSGATSDGVILSANLFSFVKNNVFYNNGRDNLRCSGGQALTRGLVAANNIFSSAGEYGINLSSATTASFSPQILNNAYYNNTTAPRNELLAETGAVTLTSDPFVSSGTGNFALNTTAGGGASCRAGGTPGVFPAGLTTGFLDIGAVQHSATNTFTGGINGSAILGLP